MSEKFKKEIIEWIKVIATALVFAFIITQFIRPTLVRGESMYPTLVENDYLIIYDSEDGHYLSDKTFGSRTLKTETIITYNDYIRIEFIEELNYPLMYVEEITD